MTPKRIEALEYFHERGEVCWFGRDAPSETMRRKMAADGQLERVNPPDGKVGMVKFRLTDKGREDLHDATR